jgi:Acetyltransferase (GNAT) family
MTCPMHDDGFAAGAVLVRDTGFSDVSAASEVKATGWRTAYTSMVDKQVLEPFGPARYWHRALFELVGRGDSFFKLAIDGSQLVGLAHGAVEPQGYLESLLPQYSGSRFGALLMKTGVEALPDWGTKQLRLDEAAANVRAIAVHRQLGAVQSVLHSAVWSPSVDEVTMVLHDVTLAPGDARDPRGAVDRDPLSAMPPTEPAR